MKHFPEKILHLSILGLLLVFPLGQLSRVVVTDEVRFYWQDGFIVLLSFITTFFYFRQRRVRVGKFFLPILVFFLLALVSLLVNSFRFTTNEVLIGSLYLARWLVYSFIYLAILQLDIRKIPKVIEYLLLAGFASVGFGLAQYVFYPNAWPLIVDEWDPHVGRAIGTFLDPGFTGLIYVLLWVFLLVCLWDKRHLVFEHGGLVVVYLGLLLTYSRSTYLALIVAMLAISFVKKSWLFFLGFIFVFSLSLLLLPRPHGEGVRLERESTINSRIVNWQQSLEIFKNRPWLGTGFNLYRYEQRDFFFLGKNWQKTHAGAGADSSLLFILATTGVLGASAYGWLWYRVVRLAFEKRRQALGLILLGSSLAVVVHSFLNNSLFYPWIMIWFWILLGICEKLEFREYK